jgi:diguanylate cyclase (GGDEF)-like protein
VLSRLFAIVRRNPRASAQDGVLITAVMLVSLLLALEYDLFSFVAELSEPQRRISLAEAIFLTLLLAACIVVFVLRRLNEERRHAVQGVAMRNELRKLRALVSEDPLTALANRRALVAALATATSDSSGRRQDALFLLDLDGFKRINDEFGHALGDRVLQVIAERLRQVMRPNDLLARLGGDEFAVLSMGADRNAAAQIGRRFVEAVDQEMAVAGQIFRVGVSIGVALIPNDGRTPEEALESADLAMYAAKRTPASSMMFFEPGVRYPQRAASLIR